MKTGILFDLDGTLLNTLEDILDATNYALTAHGFPPRTLAELRRFVGNGAENQIRLSVGAGADEKTVMAVLDTYRPYYAANCLKKTKPYEGIAEALAELSEKYPVAIVSNKPDGAVKPLCARFFPDIFALGERAGVSRKPAPDMVFEAVSSIGADTCVYVGDSEVDVKTAKNAAVPCVSVLWGFREREEIQAAGGSVFCEIPGDLPRILEEIIHGK